MGYSRGGGAVLLAASQQMTRAVLGEGMSLKAVLAAWPIVVINLSTQLQLPQRCVSWLAIPIIRFAGAVQGEAGAMPGQQCSGIHRFFKGATRIWFIRASEGGSKCGEKSQLPHKLYKQQGLLLDLYTGQPVPPPTLLPILGVWIVTNVGR